MDNTIEINSSNMDKFCEKIKIIIRQTDYDEEKAREKLIEFENDHIKVIKDYYGIKDNSKNTVKTYNQEIYKQIRKKIDISSYNKKQAEKLHNEISNTQVTSYYD
jgi:hypothetical protein